jgi:SOS-response transcriptional repressor LexA
LLVATSASVKVSLTATVAWATIILTPVTNVGQVMKINLSNFTTALIFNPSSPILRLMHPVQERLLELSKDYDVVNMRLSVIAKLANVSHLQIVKHHRDQLIKKGLLKPNAKFTSPIQAKTRTSMVNSRLLSIPVKGVVNAGPATFLADDQTTGQLHISSSLLRTTAPANQLYALKVKGRSMNQAAVGGFQTVDDGDYVIVDRREFEPRNGDYVISLLDNAANIKKFIFDKLNQQIVLISESTDDYPPIVIHPEDSINYMVGGKVVQVVKKPRFA